MELVEKNTEALRKVGLEKLNAMEIHNSQGKKDLIYAPVYSTNGMND